MARRDEPVRSAELYAVHPVLTRSLASATIRIVSVGGTVRNPSSLIAPETITQTPPTRLWNLNFALLWQGQLVSALGDVMYEIALGFWILAVTGSTGPMGALMAASMIPRVVISPFQRSPTLGPVRYGVAIAVMTTAMIAGMGVTAAIEIPAGRRYVVFGGATVAFVVPMAVFPLVGSYWLMLVLLGVGSLFGAIVTVLIQSVIQLTVPQDMRGKVFGLLETLTQGLTPIGMVIGGLLGELLPVRFVISGACVAIGVFIFPQLASRPIRAFFAMDQEMTAPDEALKP
jgi:hypothetical protein